MDQNRYSHIAHGQLPVWNPIAASRLHEFARQLTLDEGSTILDIGCGRGHMLGLLLGQSGGANAIGVDSSPYAIAAAARDLARFVAAGRLTLALRPFDASEFEPHSFD